MYCNKLIPLYIGKKRYGCLGEPQQDEFEWRCSSSGRFANPTYWMPLPKSPIEAAHGITSDMKQEHVDKTAKQRHEWVGLTDMEIQEIYQSEHWEDSDDTWDYERAIEAKLKEKNT